jgi:single-stranded-DNA-specific exonuclease
VVGDASSPAVDDESSSPASDPTATPPPSEPPARVADVADVVPAVADSARASALRSTWALSYTGANLLALATERDTTLTGDALARWLDPKLSNLTAPHAMLDRGLAIERLSRAVRAGETIAVFGDYDCDGITATAVLTQALRALGGVVVPFLATRTEGAYGLSAPAVKRILGARPGLVVTCDCGSSDHERIRDLASKGVDTVVIDHHLVPAEPLPALAFLNPHRPGCGFPYKHLASCGLALTLMAGLRQALGKELDLRRYLDLVAVGTVADVAPLTGDNRALVHAGLKVAARGGRPGLRALAELARIDLASGLTSEDIAYRIAPRLNAPGRLGTPDDALALLLTEDRATAAGLAATVEETQKRRRAVQDAMLEEALSEIADRELAAAPGIVLAREGWHPGVVGIVAGKIAEATRRPTVIIGMEGETGRGSVRGPAGFPLHDALVRCTEDLVGFGGHQAAAGVHVQKSKVATFEASFASACASLADAVRPGHGSFTVRLDPRDELEDVLPDLERFEPFGEGNPAPRLVVDGAVVRSARNLKGHLKLAINYGGASLSAIYFGRGHHAEALPGRSLTLVGSLRRNTFVGGVEIHVVRSTPELAEVPR